MLYNTNQANINGVCSKCGSTGTIVYKDEDTVLCRNCFDASYMRCPECGQYVRKEEIKEYDPGYCGRDILLCMRCAQKYGY